MRRLSPRTKAVLWLIGVALLLVLVQLAASKPAPLPAQTARLSRLVEKSLEDSASFVRLGGLLLALGAAAALVARRRLVSGLSPLLETSPAPWSPPLVALLTLTWMVGQGVATVAIALHPALEGSISFAKIIAIVWIGGSLLGMVIPLLVAFRGHLPSASQFGLRLPQKGKEFLWGFLASLIFPWLVFIGAALTYRLAKFDPFSTNPVFSIALATTSTADWLLLFLVVAVLGPILEEFLFRGLLYRSLRNLWRPLPAAVISSLFFSAIHPSLATILPIALLGVALAYLYEKTGSIVPGLAAHGLYNAGNLAVVFMLKQGLA